MSQPHIDDTLMQRLARVAAAFEMPMGKMLAHILTTALDELEGKENDYTICVPVQQTHEEQKAQGRT